MVILENLWVPLCDQFRTWLPGKRDIEKYLPVSFDASWGLFFSGYPKDPMDSVGDHGTRRTRHIKQAIRDVGKDIPQLVMRFHTLWSPTRSRIDGNHCHAGENQQYEEKRSNPKPTLVYSALFITKKGVLFHHTNPYFFRISWLLCNFPVS
jgi:hypothetical protein